MFKEVYCGQQRLLSKLYVPDYHSTLKSATAQMKTKINITIKTRRL